MRDLKYLNEKQVEDLLVEEYIKKKYPFFRMQNYYKFLKNKKAYEDAKAQGYKRLPNAILRKNGLYNTIENVRLLARRIIQKELKNDDSALSWQTRALVRLEDVVGRNGWRYPTKKNMEEMVV